MRDLIILGSGPAGLTAAIYAARAELKPLVLSGNDFGGQLMTTSHVENFPGFPEGILGPQLMQQMVKQAKRFGAEIKFEAATKVDFSGSPKSVWTDKEAYQAKAVLIATGSSPRRLNIPGEDTFYGKGVSTCATCDGAFYKGKTVAIVGGGDTAMEEAIFLTKFAQKVIIIHRRDSFRASKIMQERALKNPKIKVIWNTGVEEVLGKQTVAGLKLKNTQENTESRLPVDGMFLAIGHLPNTQFLGDSVELDEQGYVKVYPPTNTSVEGVFVAGDVHDLHYQQAVTAAGWGCQAAMDIERWLEAQK
jgi:thioredoxin reductase (NADPH)